MKHIIAFIFACCIFSVVAHAQSDTIAIKKNGLGTVYKKDGKLLSLRRLEKTLKYDATAAAQFRRGKSANDVGFVFAFAGGFLIGLDLGRVMRTGEPVNPALIGAGVGLIGVSILFSRSAQKKFKAAVHTYNTNRRRTTGVGREQELYFTFSGNAIGLTLKF